MARLMLRPILAGILAITLATAAQATDPFDTARWHIETKGNAAAIALIDSGEVDVNTQTEEGYTLLHYAAGAGNLEMVKALIARGADPARASNSGFTPYDMAIGTMVKAEIRKAVAARSGANGGQASAAPVANPGTAAIAGGNNGMCDRARKDPASSSRSPAMRPFLAAKDAIWYNHPDELAGLLEDCVAVSDVDEYGWTLLHHAAQRDRVDLARLLVERGARSGARNKDGETAADLASSAEMRALLGPASQAAAPAAAADRRKLECRQKYEADAALASDSTGRMSAMRRWQKCLDTGLYW